MTDTDRQDDAGPRRAPRLPPTPAPPAPGGRRHGGGGHGGETPSYETGGLRLALVVGALALLGLRFGWSVLAIVLGVVVMIFLHELGHYATAKWSGMKVTEFFIGFGPRIWSFQRGETEYGLKAIPAGAYVRIIGMNNLDEVDPADEPRTYRQQSFPKRLLVVSAGSIMHMAQAFVLLVILLGVVGVPGGSLSDESQRARDWEVGSVVPDSAAGEAGLLEGDRIVAFDGEPVETWAEVTSAIRGSDVGDEVVLTVERGDQTVELEAVLGPRPAAEGGDEGAPFLGVGARTPIESIGLGRAIVAAPGELVGFTSDAVAAMAGFFSPSGLSDFADNVGEGGGGGDPATAPSGSGGSGTVDDGDGNRLISIYGAIRMGNQLSEDGWMWVLLMFFQINVFIGILNMAPLPPLDGGHAAVAIYERVRSRRGQRYQVDMTKLLPLTYAVVMGLIVLGIAALYLDIVNPIDI